MDQDFTTEQANTFQYDVVAALRLQLRAAYLEEQEALMHKFDRIVDQWVQSQDILALQQRAKLNSGTHDDLNGSKLRACTNAKDQFIANTVAQPDLMQSECAQPPSNRTSGVESELLKQINTSKMRFAHLNEPVENIRRTRDANVFYKNALGPLGFCVEWWAMLEEPARSGRIATVVQGHSFELVCLAVIISNTIYTIFDTNYSIEHMTKKKPFPMAALDIVFTCFYVVEIGLKLWVHRLYFFCNEDMRWNILDAFLVISGILEVLTDNSSNPSFVRMVRVVRITRVLRMVRLLRFFAELRLMLTCVIGSLMSLFWAFFLILCFSVLFAIILVQHLTTFLVEQQVSEDLQSNLNAHFGSVQIATFTLFKGISGGDWTKYFDIVTQTGWFNTVVFLMYILFVWLSVTNIITCIFVEKAMKLAQPGIEELLFEKRKAEVESAEELQKLFQSVDQNQSGAVSWQEFEKCMSDDAVASYFAVNGLNINDAYIFFRMLASTVGSTEIDLNTFVRGCLKMKGVAMNIDLLQLSYEVKVISKSQQHLFRVLEKEMTRLCNVLTSNQQKLSNELGSNVFHVCTQLIKMISEPHEQQLMHF